MNPQASNSGAAMNRGQHLIPAIVILVLACVVAWLSYTREPADAFLFPRLIGSVMLVLAVWNFIRAVSGLARVGDGLSAKAVYRFLPGTLIMIVFALFAAKFLGFYVAAWLAFFGVFSIYDSASHLSAGSWIKRLFITTGFMAVIYGLFDVLLKVQTPRGLFF